MYYYNQYKKEFNLAQKTGKYTVYSLDVVDSKKHFLKDSKTFYQKLSEFLSNVTKDLLLLEETTNTKILHRHLNETDLINHTGDIIRDKVVLVTQQNNNYLKHTKKLHRVDQQNPLLWLGDSIYLITNRDSISEKDMTQLLQKNKDKFVPDYDFYYGHGHYVSDSHFMIDDELPRKYCIVITEELAKNSQSKLISPNSLKTHNNEVEMSL